MPTWWGGGTTVEPLSASQRRRSAYENEDYDEEGSGSIGSEYFSNEPSLYYDSQNAWSASKPPAVRGPAVPKRVAFTRVDGRRISFRTRSKPARTILPVHQMKPAMRAMHACAIATAGMTRTQRQGKEMRVPVPARYQRARPADEKLYANILKKANKGDKGEVQLQYALAFEREYGPDRRPYLGKTVLKRRHTGGAMRSCVKTLFASQEKMARYALTHNSRRRRTPSAVHTETIRRLRRAFE